MADIMKDERLKRYYIELNQEQLHDSGTDSNGNPIIPPYSRRTMEIKRRKGQVSDHVTLKDTGKFYKSFKITVFRGGFIIDADGQKQETNLFDKYGIDILGLDDNSMIQFQDVLAREIRTKILELI